MKIKQTAHKEIKSFKIFGYSLYSKLILKETTIDLNFEPVHCEDMGLYVIGKYPRFQFGNSHNSEDFNWQWHAERTLLLTLLNLINKGAIEIVEVKYLKKVLINYLKFAKTDYYLRVTDHFEDKDWLTDLWYKTINEINKTKAYPVLFDYIHKLLDEVIHKHGTYNKPTRYFIIELLKQNAKRHPWIDINKKKRFWGVMVNNNLKVSEIYIPRLNMQHNAMNSLYQELFNSNHDFKEFCLKLHIEIDTDFKRRISNN